MRLLRLFEKKHEIKQDQQFERLLKLDAGSRLQFNSKIWIVKKILEYNWGDNINSFDFIVDNGDKLAYIGIEHSGNTFCISVKYDVALEQFEFDLPDFIARNEVPPEHLKIDNIQYQYDRESVGKCRIEDTSEWMDIISWEFIDKSNNGLLTIELYSNKEFFASVGKVAHPNDFQIIE